MGSVALLCDATEATGLGHLSRCVALGEALVEAGASVTVVGAIADPFRAVLADSGIDLHPAVRPLGDPDALAERRSALVERGVDRVVVDSYAIATEDVAALSSAWPVTVIDDFARLPAYPCDLVLNFTVGAPDLPYPPHAGLLLGPTWFLARRALRDLRRAPAPSIDDEVGRVLVAIGGADASGTTATVVAELSAIAPHLVIDVVAGRPLPEAVAVDRALLHAGPGSALTVGAPSLVPHLRHADLVVCGGGLTKYEAAFVGIPAAVIDQSADQAAETTAFSRRGLAVSLGGADDPADGDLGRRLGDLLADPARRRRMAAAGRAAFPDDPTLAAAHRLLVGA